MKQQPTTEQIAAVIRKYGLDLIKLLTLPLNDLSPSSCHSSFLCASAKVIDLT